MFLTLSTVPPRYFTLKIMFSGYDTLTRPLRLGCLSPLGFSVVVMSHRPIPARSYITVGHLGRVFLTLITVTPRYFTVKIMFYWCDPLTRQLRLGVPVNTGLSPYWLCHFGQFPLCHTSPWGEVFVSPLYYFFLIFFSKLVM